MSSSRSRSKSTSKSSSNARPFSSRNLAEAKNYTKNVSEPWFSLIKCGLKTTEGRLNKGDFAEMKRGDLITFTNEEMSSLGKRSFQVRITSKRTYPSFDAYLRGETLKRALPPVDTLEEGVAVYHQYYTPADEATFGIVAIRMVRV
jgi:ASC-1-like (ASCH) protein